MIEDIVKFFILPSNLIILCFISGIISVFIKKTGKLSRYLLIIAVFIYVVFATGPFAFWLLGNLEYKYPYYKNFENNRNIETIVILTAYAEFDSKIPLSSRVNSPSAFRLLEAMRIFTVVSHADIIITGSGDIPKIMKELLVSLGLPDNRILIENNSNSTFESAENVRSIVSSKPVILVTSAGHMPRSIMAFNKAGITAIPAPTHYLTRKNNLAISYLPSPLHLRYSDLAIHEYAAIFWYRLINRI